MAERPTTRLYLADLMMAVLMCGLVAALFTSVRTPPNVALTFFLIFIVLMSWSVFQSRRQAPTCEECGRRFIRPKQAVMLSSCPHCGRDQVELSRLIRRVKRVFWGLMGLLVLLVVVALVAVAGFSNRSFEMIAMVCGLIAACGMTLTMLVTVGVATYRWFLQRPRERTCKGCGSLIPARPPAGPMICPECRVRHLRPAEAKKEQTKNLAAVLVFCGLLGLVGIFLVPLPTGSGSGVSWWIRAPLLVLASAAVAFTVLVVTLTLVILLRHRQLRSERGAQTVARKCAGQEGEVVKEGPWVIWYSGPDDPVPMVREQMEAAPAVRNPDGCSGHRRAAYPAPRLP